ncbi:hypothetical protein [Nocardia wallacei]|uniref:hypothetical protein n=1 Tax=Nocardia wallacei TaxID=480035 RepID=UPI002457FB3E|nr:hypothetical protein [Nocardia wallacei]
MRFRPTALGWVDTEVSDALMWDRAQVQRLARHLGYLVVWPEASFIPLADQVRAADVVITPSPQHLSPLEVNGILYVAEIETISPRMGFARWTLIREGADAGRIKPDSGRTR